MKDSVSGSFPYSDMLPFGSTVNGFGKRGCDLDIAIRLYPEKVIIFVIFLSLLFLINVVAISIFSSFIYV